jgi:ApeA N-terminal domain 1
MAMLESCSRLMIRDRSTTYQGRWWLASDDTQKFDGTLTLNDHSSGELALSGTAQAFLDAGLGGPSQKAMTLHAVVEEDYHYELTLFDTGFMQGPSYGFDKQQQTTVKLFTNSFVLGAHVKSLDDPIVSCARLNLGGLSAFCDTTHISSRWKPPRQSDVDKLRIDLKSHATRWIALNKASSIRFFATFDGPRVRSKLKTATVSVTDFIDLKFHRPISLSQLSDRVNDWQSFVSFCVRQPSYLESVRFSGEKAGHFYPFQFVIPGERPDNSIKEKIQRELLLSRSKLEGTIRETVRLWAKLIKSAEIPIMLFTGSQYQKGIFIHGELLTTLQAIESLHRDLYDDTYFPDKVTRSQTVKYLRKSLPETLPTELRKQISEQLSFIGGVTLRDRLLDFYDKYPVSISKLFRSREYDMSLLKDVRNFLTHYGDRKHFDRRFLESRRILILNAKVNLFFEVCLLGALGFSDDKIGNIMQSTDDYAGLTREPHHQ